MSRPNLPVKSDTPVSEEKKPEFRGPLTAEEVRQICEDAGGSLFEGRYFDADGRFDPTLLK